MNVVMTIFRYVGRDGGRRLRAELNTEPILKEISLRDRCQRVAMVRNQVSWEVSQDGARLLCLGIASGIKISIKILFNVGARGMVADTLYTLIEKPLRLVGDGRRMGNELPAPVILWLGHLRNRKA